MQSNAISDLQDVCRSIDFGLLFVPTSYCLYVICNMNSIIVTAGHSHTATLVSFVGK